MKVDEGGVETEWRRKKHEWTDEARGRESEENEAKENEKDEKGKFNTTYLHKEEKGKFISDHFFFPFFLTFSLLNKMSNQTGKSGKG